MVHIAKVIEHCKYDVTNEKISEEKLIASKNNI
jgi:hypothetical protein